MFFNLNLKGVRFLTNVIAEILYIIKMSVLLIVFAVKCFHICTVTWQPPDYALWGGSVSLWSIVNISRWQRQIMACRHKCSSKQKMKWDKKQSPTSFTRASQVSSPRAVTHIAVPALSTDPIVLAGVAQTLLRRLLRAGGLDPSSLLDLGQAPDILTLSINEQIPNAAHVPIVE